MPDLLTHVLVAYMIAVGSARFEWFHDRYVPVVMVGSVAPDVMKLSVVLGFDVGVLFGIPYSTWGVHTLGGAIVLAGLGALTICTCDRLVGAIALATGSASHLLLDAAVIRVDGTAPPYLFPLTNWLPPAGNLYASTDVWPTVVTLVVAIPVWLLRRQAR